ncbi:MAG: carboxyl transferase domain-containing protein [Pseudomonadota bacterium]
MNDAYHRIEGLVDPASFEEFAPAGRGNYITGRARVAGRGVYISAANTAPPTMTPLEGVAKQAAFFEAVERDPAPLALIVDAPGTVQQAGGKTPIPPDADRLMVSADGVGRLYSMQARLRYTVPQIAVVVGRVGAALSFPVSLCDVVVMARQAAVCIGRPDAVRFMIGQETDFERLGGAAMHCTVSGVGDVLAEDTAAALAWARRWLSRVPEAAGRPCPVAAPAPPAAGAVPPDDIVPADPNRPFDMHALVAACGDAGSFLETKALFAPESLVGLGRIAGRTVGVIANNSVARGGILFPETCRKMTDFIRFCDGFGIPMVFFADTPGFMVGEETEATGIVRAGADLLAAIARASVPKLCVVVRKAYTAGLYAMAGPGFDPRHVWALPSASVSIFGRKALERFAAARDINPQDRQRVAMMIAQSEDPRLLVEKGLIERVIRAAELRPALVRFLENAANPALTPGG